MCDIWRRFKLILVKSKIERGDKIRKRKYIEQRTENSIYPSTRRMLHKYIHLIFNAFHPLRLCVWLCVLVLVLVLSVLCFVIVCRWQYTSNNGAEYSTLCTLFIKYKTWLDMNGMLALTATSASFSISVCVSFAI